MAKLRTYQFKSGVTNHGPYFADQIIQMGLNGTITADTEIIDCIDGETTPFNEFYLSRNPEKPGLVTGFQDMLMFAFKWLSAFTIVAIPITIAVYILSLVIIALFGGIFGG